MDTKQRSSRRGVGRAPSELKKNDGKAEARAAEKRKVAARRQELLLGLSAEDKSEMTSFMGSVNAKARSNLQDVVRLLSSSGKDPRLLIKKVLVHGLAHLSMDRCISFLETMVKLGQEATLQLLWLYERYSVPNAGNGMTKCSADHFGRDIGVGRMDEIFGMDEEDKKALVLQLADWDPLKKVKVVKAWEATDPRITAEYLLGLIREEQVRSNTCGNLWQCSLCPIKHEVEIEARMRRGEHRRKDRTVDAGVLYDYHSEGKGATDIYRSPHDSLFAFTPPIENVNRRQRSRRRDRGAVSGKGVGQEWQDPQSHNVGCGRTVGGGSIDGRICSKPAEGGGRGALSTNEARQAEETEAEHSPSRAERPLAMIQTPHLILTYAGREFDPRRMCAACTEELRGAVISSGHDLEVWHTVDNERRALMERQHQNDLFKAGWAEREREYRQVSELLRLVCEANLEAFSRHSIEERARANRDIQAAGLRTLLDLKLSNLAAVEGGATKDEGLKRSNEKEATSWAATLRLKASLNMDRTYASLEPGGISASLRRRHTTSTKPADFLDDGTPVTPQGATQTFGRAGPPPDDESADIHLWKLQAEDAEDLLDRRQEVRDRHLLCGRQARFSYLCGRWLGAASDIEELQRLKKIMEDIERERRKKEREAAELRRKQQLADLRAAAGCRATGEARRIVEHDKEAEEIKKREEEELEKMKKQEVAQLADGDRYWGIFREIQRLRALEDMRRIAWEARIRVTREKMVAVRCISELSAFSHATPPKDPELAQKIETLAAM